jgi:uncharacterized protein YdaU (DUF1376 family)
MNGLPYYKAYPRDFVEGTIGMPFEIKCAYRVVIDLIYMQGGRLPDDARYISGHLGCTIRKWKIIRNELVSLGKLNVIDGFLANYRADNELEILRKLQEKQAENGRAPRKIKGLQKPRLNHTEPEPDNISSNDDIGASASAHAQKLTPRQELETVLDEERADAVIEHRQRMRKPLTARAAKMLAGKLSKADDPNRAADLMIERGWAGFEVDWMRGTRGNDPPSKAKPNIWDDAFGLSGPLTIDADPLP